MSENYLWDKSGSDPEIESLENALAVFKYQETDIPVVPRAVVIPSTPFWARFFSLRLAFGTMTAAAVLVGIIWFGLRPAAPPTLTSSIKAEAVQNSISEVVKDPRRSDEPQPVQPLPVAAPRKILMQAHASRRPRAVPEKVFSAQKPLDKNTELVALTKEEREAYGQLILALAITGSKLKLVQDTIDRIEDTGSSDKQR